MKKILDDERSINDLIYRSTSAFNNSAMNDPLYRKFQVSKAYFVNRNETIYVKDGSMIHQCIYKRDMDIELDREPMIIVVEYHNFILDKETSIRDILAYITKTTYYTEEQIVELEAKFGNNKNIQPDTSIELRWITTIPINELKKHSILMVENAMLFKDLKVLDGLYQENTVNLSMSYYSPSDKQLVIDILGSRIRLKPIKSNTSMLKLRYGNTNGNIREKVFPVSETNDNDVDVSDHISDYLHRLNDLSNQAIIEAKYKHALLKIEEQILKNNLANESEFLSILKLIKTII